MSYELQLQFSQIEMDSRLRDSFGRMSGTAAAVVANGNTSNGSYISSK